MPLEPPREGGGPNPPYGEDFFQRIVNVHWRTKKPGTLIAVLLPSAEPGIVILSLPVISRTVVKDGFTEFGA
jgi:hypothetical protein